MSLTFIPASSLLLCGCHPHFCPSQRRTGSITSTFTPKTPVQRTSLRRRRPQSNQGIFSIIMRGHGTGGSNPSGGTGSSRASNDDFRSKSDLAKNRSGLELSWKYQNMKFEKPEVCPDCRGHGTLSCGFCNATGFMMVGDTLLCSATGQSHCPVCKSKGEVKCPKCRATGYIAKWLL